PPIPEKQRYGQQTLAQDPLVLLSGAARRGDGKRTPALLRSGNELVGHAMYGFRRAVLMLVRTADEDGNQGAGQVRQAGIEMPRPLGEPSFGHTMQGRPRDQNIVAAQRIMLRDDDQIKTR